MGGRRGTQALIGISASYNTLYEDAKSAATAKVRGLTVLTRNVADINALGLEVFNPFEYV